MKTMIFLCAVAFVLVACSGHGNGGTNANYYSDDDASSYSGFEDGSVSIKLGSILPGADNGSVVYEQNISCPVDYGTVKGICKIYAGENQTSMTIAMAGKVDEESMSVVVSSLVDYKNPAYKQKVVVDAVGRKANDAKEELMDDLCNSLKYEFASIGTVTCGESEVIVNASSPSNINSSMSDQIIKDWKGRCYQGCDFF